MPSIQENKSYFDGSYNWTDRGDEWSVAWGGQSMQWYGTILPRIKLFVPTNRILEIACGYGRWTQYLKDLCKNLVVVDISEECIQACKKRFSECSHIEYHVNDGIKLDMISDCSVDFVFSFDSLVHADESVMKAYICQLQRILTNAGVAFIHHSNLGEYNGTYSRIRKIPKLEALLIQLGMLEKNLHWRDFSVDAKKVERFAEENGLRCLSQEIIPWGTKRMFIDCISTITKNNSSVSRGNRIFRNRRFMEETRYQLLLSHLYSFRNDDSSIATRCQ
jgi:Dimethyladenosine transferase (rRNA methylation)